MEFTIDQVLQKAVAAHKSGQLQEADRFYTEILKAQPKHPDANHNLGVLAVGVGKVETALPFFKTAVEANPKIVQFWLSYIDALIKLDRVADAKAVFDQAKSMGAKGDGFDQLELRLNEISEKPLTADGKSPETRKDKPNILESLQLDQAIKLAKKKVKDGSAGEAKRIYQDILEKFPRNKRAKDALDNLVDASNVSASKVQDPPQGELQALLNLYNQGLLQQALKHAESLVEKFQNSPVLLNFQGAILMGLGHLDLSVEAYKKALAIKPNYTEVYNNMGNTLKQQGKLEEAIEAYNKALALKPDYAAAYNNMGVALAYEGKVEEAIEAYNKVVELKPDNAEAYYNLGNILREQGKLEEAIEAYERAVAIKPDYAKAHENLSFSLLTNGKVKEGLDEHEWRWKTDKHFQIMRSFPKPIWDGQTSLQGQRILLWSEQGVGDTINWSSKIPVIASMAHKCILECPEKLFPLMARSFPNIEVRPEDSSNDKHRNDFDYHLPLGSLYQRLGPSIVNNTKPDAFLLPDPVRIDFWTKRLKSLGKGPYIGVCWKSANMSSKRLPNYAPLEEWSPIFTIPDVKFINLQYVHFTDDLAEIQNRFGVTVHNFDDLDHYDNLDDVAALCTALDLIVSTTCAVPFISAGVGSRTILLSWKQSAWNNVLFHPKGPGVVLYQRNTWDHWSNVFERVRPEIKNALF